MSEALDWHVPLGMVALGQIGTMIVGDPFATAHRARRHELARVEISGPGTPSFRVASDTCSGRTLDGTTPRST
ncbi:MAG: hypothetical protein ACRDJ4_00895 [Actinomycetota bacterium]